MPTCPSSCHCPRCNTEMASVMRMSTSDYSAWLQQATGATRHAAGTIRHSATKPTPMPQAKADALVREAIMEAKYQRAQTYLRAKPPNGYAIALAKKGKANG